MYFYILMWLVTLLITALSMYGFAYKKGFCAGIDKAIAYFEYMTEMEVNDDHLKGGV